MSAKQLNISPERCQDVGASDFTIVDVGHDPEYERYMYRCLAPMPFRRYRKRARYLGEAVPRGLKKEILFVDGDAIGNIEYAPSEVSAYPISGDGVWVMNCVWVLRRAKGRRFGKILVRRMIENVEDASCFATVALEGHHSPWLKLRQMEYLGFRSIDSMMMRHKFKRQDICFRSHLMWMPLDEAAEPPVMDWVGLLRGVDFCLAHPLYHAERFGPGDIFEVARASRQQV